MLFDGIEETFFVTPITVIPEQNELNDSSFSSKPNLISPKLKGVNVSFPLSQE